MVVVVVGVVVVVAVVVVVGRGAVVDVVMLLLVAAPVGSATVTADVLGPVGPASTPPFEQEAASNPSRHASPIVRPVRGRRMPQSFHGRSHGAGRRLET